ncbi:MAG: sterol carrier protein domain-containing protein [Polyangiaceae bacterium]
MPRDPNRDAARSSARSPSRSRRGRRCSREPERHDRLRANEQHGASRRRAQGARAASASRTSSAERLSLSVDRLAQIYFGAARATDLLASGFIEGDAHAAENLDAALYGLTTFGGPLNHF